MCLVLLAVAGALLTAPPARAQQEPKSPTPAAPAEHGTAASAPHAPPRLARRVTVGETAPDFELDGSRRETVRLSRLRGTRVLLVFTETHAALAGLSGAARTLAGLDTRVVGVCHDKARTLEQAASHDPGLVLALADVTGEVSAMYGLLDFEHDTTRPGLVLLDRNGAVRLALLGQTLPADDVVALVQSAFGQTP